jgi:hypothetical protein
MSWSHCPHCGSPCAVTDTRNGAGYVRRRVMCAGKPHHRFTTVELVTPHWISPEQVALLFRDLPFLARTLQPLTNLLKGLEPWQKKK